MAYRTRKAAAAALVLPIALAVCLAAWPARYRVERGAGFGRAHVPTAAQRARLAHLSVPFVANRGQVDPRVAFYAQTFAGTVFVTRAGRLVLSLAGKPRARRPNGAPVRGPGAVVVESPVSSRGLDAAGVQPAATRVSVFRGANPAHWRRDLPTYRAVTLGAPWPGVHYAVRARGNAVERIFTLAPGARAATIRVQVTGGPLSLHAGALVVHTQDGPVTLSPPVAWQPSAGGRVSVPVRYTLDGDEYGFRLGTHDASRPVYIDPLIRATYLGGSGYDSAAAAVTDPSSGYLYLAGQTQSTDFPHARSGFQPQNAGATDAFVARLNPELTELYETTYLGGTNDDYATSIAIAPAGTPDAGEVYVSGDTHSTDFPGTSGGAQPACAGTASDCANSGDAFVAVLAPYLGSLLQATYLGGTDIDDARALAVAPASTPDAGDVYVAGRTISTDFPGTAGGAQPLPNAGSYDAFVAAFNPGLTSLVQSTYLGGGAVDEAYAMAIAPGSGDVYVAGDTTSADFPCTTASGPPPLGGSACIAGSAGAQSVYGGSFDGFASLLTPGLTGLVQSTYLGGSGADYAFGMALSGSGVYVVGQTSSSDFPGTGGGAQPDYDGNGDGFAVLLDDNLTTLQQATYLGGSRADSATAVAVNPANGDVYVAGSTTSSDFPCTAPDGPDPSGGTCVSSHAGAQFNYSGAGDAFLALLKPSLAGIVQGTYFGGRELDQGNAVTLAPASGTAAPDVYIAGVTASVALPGTAGAALPAYAGSSDGYAALFTPDLQGPQLTVNLSVTAPQTIARNTAFSYKAQIVNSTAPTAEFDGNATNVLFLDTLPTQVTFISATASQGQACTVQVGVVQCQLGTLSANGGSATVSIKVRTAYSGSATNAAKIFADQAFGADSVSEVSQTTTIPTPGENAGAASALAPWTLLGLVLLAAILGWERRRRVHQR